MAKGVSSGAVPVTEGGAAGVVPAEGLEMPVQALSASAENKIAHPDIELFIVFILVDFSQCVLFLWLAFRAVNTP